MRIKPRFWIGFGIYLAYCAWVFSVWAYRGIDYRQVGTEAGVVVAVLQPLGIAAIALALFNTAAGWWSLTLFESKAIRRPGLLAVLLVAMLGFIAANLIETDFSALSCRHLMLLGAGMLLVGLCEEMITRGVLLVSLRQSLSEGGVWFWSSALFGLIHAPNAFFGVGPLALVQVGLAFCAGTGLYLLRRFTGTLLVPMVIHALWDFSSIVNEESKSSHSVLSFVFIGLTYSVSLILVFVVFRSQRDRR